MNSRTLSLVCVVCLLCGVGVCVAAPNPTSSATPTVEPVTKSTPLWPQTIRMPEGTITLHPAELRRDTATTLTGAVTISILPVGALKPAHGRLEFSSPYRSFPATRSLVCYNATVRAMTFPTATSPAELRLLRAMKSRVGLWEMNFPLSRLDSKQSKTAVPDILPPMIEPPTPPAPVAPVAPPTAPPVAPSRASDIFGPPTAPPVAQQPLFDPVNVYYEGTPTFRLMTGTKNIYYATNSRGTVLRCSGTYYTQVQGCWYYSQSSRGGWKVAFSLPYVIRTEIPTSYVTTSGVSSMGYSNGYYPGHVASWIPVAPQNGVLIPNFQRYGTGVGYYSNVTPNPNAPYVFRLVGNRWVRYNPNPTSPGDRRLPPTRPTRPTQNNYDPYARWSFRDPAYFNRPSPQTTRQRGTQTIYGYQRDVRRTQQGYNPQQTSPRYNPRQTSPRYNPRQTSPRTNPRQTTPRQTTPTRPRGPVFAPVGSGGPKTRPLKVGRK